METIAIDTYVISLNNPHDLIGKLKSLGFNPKWFLGTNGNDIEPRELANQFTPLWCRIGPKNAQGIALSHLNLWKQFLKNDSEFLLVLEDDVVLVDDAFAKLQDALNNTPNDFDVLYLGYFGSQSTTSVFTTLMSLCSLKSEYSHKVNKYVSKPAVALATHAYVLSKKGAQKLVDNLEGKIFQHIDYCLQSLSYHKVINTYVMTPRIAFQTSTYNKTSSNVTNSHPLLFNNWLAQYEIDTMVHAKYLTTLSAFRIGNLNVTISTFILFLIGVILCLFGVSATTATLWFLILSLPDLLHGVTYTVFHYILFISSWLFILLTYIIRHVKIVRHMKVFYMV
jgi:GR25 family glycosyltransferase involved in LPS biosynthesis